ncbi:MAG: phosphate ABC transporter substrate-binding protein PstS [Thermoplasmata archaeon]
MIAVVAVIIVVLLIVVVGYSAGWFNSKSSSSTGVGCTLPSLVQLKGEGSTLVAPLMDQWAVSYWNGAAVTYDSAGSSAGIQAVTAKTVDFGASDAPLTYAQRAAAPGILTIPESAGGVVPIYNLAGISTSLNFNGSVLAQIFTGSITNWNNTALQALNPHVVLPVATIVPVHRTGGSGTTFIFTSFISLENAAWAHTYGKNTAWPTNITIGVGASGNGGVASTVGTTPDSIGYVDLNYALNAASGVGVGSVQNPKGNFIHATVANTESALVDSNVTLPTGTGDWYNVSLLNAPGANDYPITSLTYVLVYQNLNAYSSYTLTNAENLVNFLHWIVTVGQNQSALLYYVPLTSAIVSADLTSINTMVFGTETIPVCVPT